jgi:hypothetical protein
MDPWESEMSEYGNLTICSSLEEAHLQIRQLEARGDFKYKGITRLYETVEKMTSEFWVKHQLPSVPALARSVDLKEEKVLEYLDALTVGQSPIIRKITIVENNPKNDGDRGIPSLRTHDVFCRPTKKDNNNAEPYFRECVNRSYAVLKDFFTKQYTPATRGELKNYLLEHINNNTFLTSYISHLMMHLFESSFDNTNHLKKLQNEVTIKPIIRELVKSRVLFFAKKQGDAELAFNSILLVQNKDELTNRFQVLSDYFTNHILTWLMDHNLVSRSEVMTIQESEDLENETVQIRELVALALRKKNELNPIYYQIISELLIFAPHIISSQRKEEQEKKVKQMTEVLEHVKNANSLIDIKQHKFGDAPLTDEMAKQLIGQENILHTDFALNKKVCRFVAHQENLPVLVRGAKTALEIRKNPNELRILMQMGIDDLLDENDKKVLTELEYAFLYKYIGVFKKLLMALFRKKPDAALLKEIRQTLDKAQMQDMDNARKVEAQERVKEIEKKVIQREKEQKKAQAEGKSGSSGGASGSAVEVAHLEEEQERVEEDMEKAELNKQIMDNILGIVDDAWKAGELPTRLTVNEHFPDFNEEQLIRFLKRESKGQIRSFRVRSEEEKFKWPILISKKWLQRYGNKMLVEAKEKADEQRQAQFPNQEKFEYYDALESFLTKELARPK